MVSLSSSIVINPNGAAQLPWAPTPTALKGPTEHGALRETIALGQFATRTPAQELGSNLLVEPLGPFHSGTEGLACLPGPMVALLTLKAPQMQPQQDGALQDGQVAKAPRPTILNSGTTRLALGTHDRGIPSFEMQIQPRGADDLIDDAEFWQTEQGFDRACPTFYTRCTSLILGPLSTNSAMSKERYLIA